MYAEENKNELARSQPGTLQLEDTLNQISSSRQLEKIVNSIERFLNSQILRIEESLGKCRLAVDNDRKVQSLLVDFQRKQQEWEETRRAEIERLNQAGDDLVQGWQKLERERQLWIEQRNKNTVSGNASC